MMYKYFKYALCFLTAVGCDRALCGVHFYCEKCKTGVEWEKWWTHDKEKHNGEHIAPSFLSCPASACKNLCLSLKKTQGCVQNVDEHIASVHGDKYITYDLRCGTCQKIIPRQFWEMHLQKSHRLHLFLPYSFYCKECKGVYKTAKEWGEYVLKCKNRLQKESEWSVFYCPKCKKWPETFYEDHIAKFHPKQCIYCFEEFEDEKSRGQHMKKAHKIFCPFCDKDKFEVPLTVHIVREHEIWEGPCPWDSRLEWRCGKCEEVIGCKNSRGTVKFPEGCYSDILSRKLLTRLVQHCTKEHWDLNEVNMELYNFVQDIKEIESSDKEQRDIDKAAGKIYDKMGRFCIREGIMKISVEPCYGRDYFRYSGWWHVLKGHNHHKGDTFDICTYCKNPLVQKNDDKRHKQKEVVNEHWEVFHKGMRYCRLCGSVCLKENFGKHLMSDHKDAYWECPVCKEAVSKRDFSHGVTEHQAGIGFCPECNRIGTGSCPNCGEWVFKQCEKCPQRVYGTCPQCKKNAFGSCPDCRQCIKGKCDLCKEAVKGKVKKGEMFGKCPDCGKVASGECPVCGEEITGWCAKCLQQVVGECPVCGKCASGACSDCKQKVGSAHNIYVVFISHMLDKHKNKKCTFGQNVVDYLNGLADTCKNTTWDFGWCEVCAVPVSKKNNDWIAHCRDRHRGYRHGWCEICELDFNGTRSDHLKEHSSVMQHCNGCGYDVLPGFGFLKWHLMHHTCYCLKCDKVVPFEHMRTEHNCTLACNPTVDYGKRVWIFNHGGNCDNRHWWKCDLDGCKEKGSGDAAFREHIIKNHGCTKKCKYRRENFQFKVDHNGCDHEWRHCPFNKCSFSGTRAEVLSHVYSQVHGCSIGKCGYRNGRFEHAMNCKWKIRKCWLPLSPEQCFSNDRTIKPTSYECLFEGTKEQLEDHIRRVHGCCDFCEFNNEGFFQHACTCSKRVFVCPFCVDDDQKISCVKKEHLRKHGCKPFCHVNQYDNDIDHDPKCPNRGNFKPSKDAVSRMKEFVKKLNELSKAK